MGFLRPSPKQILVTTISASVFLLLVMGLLLYPNTRHSYRHAPLLYAAIQVRVEATSAHLRLKKIMSGDVDESIEEVWNHFDRADGYVNAMLEGIGDAAGYSLLTDPRMRASIVSMRHALERFRAIAEQRDNDLPGSGPGSPINLQFDQRFTDFSGKAEKVESMAHERISTELSRYRLPGAILAGLSALMMFCLSGLLYRREKQRNVLLKSLGQANRSIEIKNRKLEYLQHFDPLTGLPNRVLFKDRLNQTISICRSGGSALALLFIDLDHFKSVNDRFGHGYGDEVLRQAADRIRGCIRGVDSLVRISGDEFIVILFRSSCVDAITKLSGFTASRILEAIREPFDLRGRMAHISASIGVAIYPADGADAEMLSRSADSAMNHAKRMGKNNCQFFSAELNRRAMKKLEIEHDLQDAIRLDQFELRYHPQWELQSGRICGVEVMVRWRHPRYGLLAPDAFIPVAESSGLIQRLDILITSKTLNQVRKWVCDGVCFGRVAINVSSGTFRQPGFLLAIEQCLKETGVSGELIEMEITESMLLDDREPVRRILGGLNRLGILVAVDDFGTGYSSMTYLKDFPVQILKIDRSFVADCDTDRTSSVILRNMISLGNDLDLKVVAEGIETRPQLRYLKQLGCAVGQGNILSTPISADEFRVFLSARNHSVVASDGL